MIKKIKAVWTAGTGDYEGIASATTEHLYDGRIIGACTVPGADGDAPDPNYDITVKDVDNVDIALGALMDRHTSNTQYVAEASMAGVAKSKLTIAVAGAGSANKGTLYLYIR
jgi:hypothetical protein